MSNTIVAETKALHKIGSSNGMQIQISNGPGARNNSSHGGNTVSRFAEVSRKDNETQISFIKDPKLEDHFKS